MHSNWQANIEVFFLSQDKTLHLYYLLTEAAYNSMNADHATEYTPFESGWYWWSCSPGCLPDSEPIGPYETEEDALSDALEIE